MFLTTLSIINCYIYILVWCWCGVRMVRISEVLPLLLSSSSFVLCWTVSSLDGLVLMTIFEIFPLVIRSSSSFFIRAQSVVLWPCF